MKKQKEPKMSKDEKDRRALYNAVEGRLKEVRQCLKLQYMDPKLNYVEDEIIHGINMAICDIKSIFFAMLLDGESAREILRSPDNRLGTRILPVRCGR